MAIQNNPENSPQNLYYQNLEKKLSQRQLDALDAMDGTKDKNIAKDVFTIAKAMIEGTPFQPESQEVGAKAMQVQFILQTKEQAYEEWGQTFRERMSNEAVAEDLGISPETAEALAALNPKEGMDGIDRTVYYMAKTIQMGQPYYDKNGQNQTLFSQVQQILGAPNSQYTSEKPSVGI